MLDSLKLLNVTQRIEYNVMCIVFKLKNKLLPSYLCENLMYIHNVYNNMTLRNAENFRLPKKTKQKSLFYDALQNYNCLPTKLKNCKTLSIFKETLKCHMMEEELH